MTSRPAPSWQWTAGAVLVLAIAWPATWPAGRDGYPLSSFPMFARGRTEPVLAVHHVLAEAPDGTLAPVGPAVVGNGSVMQAAAMVARAISGGQADRLCREVVTRQPGSLLVATSWFDVTTYFQGKRSPTARQVHARCSAP